MANKPWLGKKLSEEHKRKISEGLKGHKTSKETREKIGRANSIALLGNTPWNKGKKGVMPEPWNKGTKGVCKANSGSFKEDEVHHNMPHTEEAKKKMGEAVKNAWIEGKFDNRQSPSEETREKIRETLIIKYGIETRVYPKEWNKTFKEKIRKRDNYKCQICDCPQQEQTKKLCVHHIDYDKENIDKDNLIALCNSCHSKTNYHREKWIKFFKEA